MLFTGLYNVYETLFTFFIQILLHLYLNIIAALKPYQIHFQSICIIENMRAVARSKNRGNAIFEIVRILISKCACNVNKLLVWKSCVVVFGLATSRIIHPFKILIL